MIHRVLILCVAFFLVGCSDYKEIDKKEYDELSEAANHNSAEWWNIVKDDEKYYYIERGRSIGLPDQYILLSKQRVSIDQDLSDLPTPLRNDAVKWK